MLNSDIYVKRLKIMPNPIPKLPNADNHSNQNANQTAKNSSGAAVQLKISAVQSREIFGQVNVNLKLNTRNSSPEKEKFASNKKESEVERKTRQNVQQGKNSTERIEKYNGRSEKPINDNRSAEPDKQTNRPLLNVQNSSPRQTRQLNLTINNSEMKNNSTFTDRLAAAPKNIANSKSIQLNNFLGDAVKQIFRENDVYLSSRTVDNLIENHEAKNSNLSNNPLLKTLSKEVSQLVETIENQILQTSRSSPDSGHNVSHQLIVEVPQNLDEQIRAAKNLLSEIFGTNDAAHFSRLEIQQRLIAAIEMLLKNLPPEMTGNLRTFSVKDILDGFLLARGLLDSSNCHSTTSLLEMMQTFSDKITLTTMRDFGALVKVLISDAAAAKSNANLETAVEKFVRILIAVNCLEAVLTAVKLASQSQSEGSGTARTLAIVQIYELINQLVLAGERAMRDAAAEIALKNAAHGELDKNVHSVFPTGTIDDLIETDSAHKKNAEPRTVVAESALRQFLEFNPMFAHDKFLSAFENSEDARQAQNHFLDHHQIEIEQWLESGNHRLVKDFDFEKPLGIVVERGVNDFAGATMARIVLVRDGSAQGWHFLKSFLVAY